MKLKYFNLLLALAILSGCNEVEVVAPDFNFTMDSTTVSVNKEVTFNFTGDAKQISFYSGEVLKDYAFKDGRVITPDGLNLSFTTAVANGAQANQFSILVSNDFTGDYTVGGVAAATWTDVTANRALATNATQVPWGPLDLSSYLVADKPVYIRFKYLSKDQNINGSQRTWTIRGIELNSNSAIGVVQMEDFVSAGFQLVQKGTIQSGRSSINPISTVPSIVLRGNTLDRTEETEVWAISKPIFFKPVPTENGPDKPVQVKGLLDVRVSNWKHTYTKPGTYIATFVAANNTVYGNPQVVKQMTITVNP